MAKQLNIDLMFNANTSKAKAAIEDLSRSLSHISSGAALTQDLPITKEIREATEECICRRTYQQGVDTTIASQSTDLFGAVGY